MGERHTRVWASQIAEIKPSDAKATNSPGDNQIPKKTAGEDKFTWVDAGVGNVKNDGTVNPTNLLSNGDFENWSAGASVAPDGWTLSGIAAIIAREATIVKLGTYSAKLTRSGANAFLSQNLINSINYRGRTITVSVWCYAVVANRARISLAGNFTSVVYSSYHTGDSTWQLLQVTANVHSEETLMQFAFVIDTANTYAYIDGAMCVEGESVFAFSPKPLSGDSSGEINSLTDKASPVDTDVTLIEDNTATPINQKKKLSWSNIKATLKTYFDGFYYKLFAQTIVVAKSGGDYTTITAALAAITDAATDKRYLIKIMPGTYVEAITMKAFVDIDGSGFNDTIIQQADATIITSNAASGGNWRLSNININLSAPTAARSLIIFPDVSAVNATMENCKITFTGNYNSFAVNISVNAAMTDVRIKNCIIKGPSNSYGWGVKFGNNNTATITRCSIENCDISNVVYGVYAYLALATVNEDSLCLKNNRISAGTTCVITYINTNDKFNNIYSYNNTYLTGNIQLNSVAATRTVTFNSYGDSIASVLKQGSGGTETFNNYGSIVGNNFINNIGKIGIGVDSPAEALDVLGNIKVSGTVDGRDVSVDGTKLDTVISNLVEDTTPQLGGDLDLNGKNIDFPSTANISDCLDEDNMASDSATKLATQQSTKAYSDLMLKGDGTKGRVLRQIYLTVGDGTNSATIKCATGSRWNGDTNALQDNIVKGSATGIYEMTADGEYFVFGNAGITGDVVAVLVWYLSANTTGNQYIITVLTGTIGGTTGIYFRIRDLLNVAKDWTTEVNSGSFVFEITYLASA